MLRLGSIGGTTIDVDFSFLFLVTFFVVLNYNPQYSIAYALVWIPILFLSVLIHEFAHAAMIGVLGFGSSQIVLTGMGGVTMNARRAKPWQNLLISLAGPASSFGLFFLCSWLYASVLLVRTDRMLVVLVPLMALANWWWALINLIPVPPLDGGHATRDFLRLFVNERNSFIVSFWIAMIVGIVVIAWAIKARSFMLALFVAWFLYSFFQQWQNFKRTGVPED